MKLRRPGHENQLQLPRVNLVSLKDSSVERLTYLELDLNQIQPYVSWLSINFN